jgi:ligand-binding sensor domain-containing protein
MLKDVNGFLWLTSPVGLNRFDGSTFKIYYPEKNVPGTINGSYGFSLVEDSLHNIWIGTNKGLSRYDIKADTFKNFLPAFFSTESVASIIPFWATGQEVYCIEAGNLIVIYNIHSFEKKILLNLGKNAPARNNDCIPQSIYDENSNSVWILTGKHDVPGGGLLQVLLTEQKMIHYQCHCFKNIPHHAHYSYGMCYDPKRKSIWINSTDGLMAFTLSDKKFHEVPACSDLADTKSYESIAGIELDLQGKLWLLTNSKGIVIYDPLMQRVTPVFTDSTLQREISVDNRTIYCDRDGMIWCDYLSVKGLYQLIPFSSSVKRLTINFRHPLSRGEKQYAITNMLQDDQGQIWIGTLEGLNIYDPKTGALKHLTEKDFPGMKGKGIIPLSINNLHQKLWINTSEPDVLYETDLTTRKCRKIPVKDSADRETVNTNINYGACCDYKNGFIFMIDRIGIFSIDSDSAVARQMLKIPYHITNMALADEKRIFVRSHFAYTNLSFYKTDGKWVQIPTALDSIEWSCLFYDIADRSYWVGGMKQLYHFDQDFKLIRRYTDKDGLLGIDILCILKDNQGNIWFNNSEGDISRINAKTDIITVLSEKDGYKKQEFGWGTPHLKDKNGNLYFAGEGGIDQISPDKLDLFPPSIVYLQSLEVNQQTPLLTTGVNNLKELSLKYFQSLITIETGVIDYYLKGKSSIRYKLEGINDNWQYAPANYSIRFEKLPPGKYKLVIQASNSGNNFNGPEKILMIYISPAFWNTWWFRTAAFLCALALIYGWMRFRLKEKFGLQLERSEKDKQLADIRQKAAELEMQALRAQMNPHFIFNSLNSINRFILQNNRVQASEYLTKFSKLVRLILHNSQVPLITLESELESLQLYLELESLRFNYHFGYKISVAPELDIAILKVPPLIIQPYVENAIWHGLMHKEEKGQLDIELSQEGNWLFLRIADDGIGRKNATAMASKSATRHKSMGLQITADRIAMIQPAGSKEPAVRIIDLVATDGSAAGTEIIIKIPVIYD